MYISLSLTKTYENQYLTCLIKKLITKNINLFFKKLPLALHFKEIHYLAARVMKYLAKPSIELGDGK